MRAAEGLFTSRRFHEITLDDVAREAGVGKGTIYRYFTNKDDLFFQTAMNGFDELCDLLESAAPGDGPFAKQLLSACKQIGTFFRKRRPLFRMMQNEESRMHWCRGELRRQWTSHRKRMASAVANIIRRGIEKGAVREDIPAEFLAGILLGMLRTHARNLAETLGESGSLQIVVDLFLQGAGAVSRRRSATRRHLAPITAAGGGRK